MSLAHKQDPQGADPSAVVDTTATGSFLNELLAIRATSTLKLGTPSFFEKVIAHCGKREFAKAKAAIEPFAHLTYQASVAEAAIYAYSWSGDVARITVGDALIVITGEERRLLEYPKAAPYLRTLAGGYEFNVAPPLEIPLLGGLVEDLSFLILVRQIIKRRKLHLDATAWIAGIKDQAQAHRYLVYPKAA